jgi:hypothetical protein
MEPVIAALQQQSAAGRDSTQKDIQALQQRWGHAIASDGSEDQMYDAATK